MGNSLLTFNEFRGLVVNTLCYDGPTEEEDWEFKNEHLKYFATAKKHGLQVTLASFLQDGPTEEWAILHEEIIANAIFTELPVRNESPAPCKQKIVWLGYGESLGVAISKISITGAKKIPNS